MNSSTEARETLWSGLVDGGGGDTEVHTGASAVCAADTCPSFALSLCLLSNSLILLICIFRFSTSSIVDSNFLLLVNDSLQGEQ